jgi:hypothetical protein
MVERKEAVAVTSQGKKGMKIHVESYVPCPKSRFVHPPRKQSSQRFVPTCHHCKKVGHIRPNCFKLKPYEHMSENS